MALGNGGYRRLEDVADARRPGAGGIDDHVALEIATRGDKAMAAAFAGRRGEELMALQEAHIEPLGLLGIGHA
jgi:hypothetical protein